MTPTKPRRRMAASRSSAGFTLIELMITVAVVAILAAIAYPSYRQYVLRGERTAATGALLTTAQQLERCFTQFNRYDADECNVSLPFTTEGGHYQVVEVTRTATGFELEAQRQNPADPRCGNLRVNHLGQRGSQGKVNTDPNDCWRGR